MTDTIALNDQQLPQLLTPPFLQDMRTTSMTVMWEMNTPCRGYVEFGTDSRYEHTCESTVCQTAAGTFMHTAVLKGLTPHTVYRYRVVNEALPHMPTPEATFITAPEATDGDFSFGFWSDSQGLTGKSPNEPTVSIFRHMVAQNVNFALTAGDLSENGSMPEMVRPFFLERVCRHIGTKIPYFIAWGNHDGLDLAPAPELNFIRQCACLPSKDRTDRPGVTGPGRGSYAFAYRGVFFICIDEAHHEDVSNGWLDSQLNSAQCTRARLRIAVVHRPPFCEMWVPGDEELRRELVPRLENAGFSLCLSGHTHEYERGFLNGVHYVIAGGSSWLDLIEPIVREWDHFTVGGKCDMAGAPRAGLLHNYVLFTLHDDTLTGTMHSFDSAGNYTGVRDEFHISTIN